MSRPEIKALTGVLSDHFSEDELAAQLGVKKRALRNWRQRRVGPPWAKLPSKQIIYPRAGLPPWLQSLEQKPGRKAAR
jgi:hypothetical protein